MIIKHNGSILKLNGTVLKGQRKTPSPIYHWTFNNTLYDEIQNFPLTTGGTPVYDTGKVGNAIVFGGGVTTGNEIGATNSAIWDVFQNNNPWTISWWQYMTYPSQQYPAYLDEALTSIVIEIGAGGGGYISSYATYQEQYNNYFDSRRTNNQVGSDHNWDFSLNTWYNIVLGYDGATFYGWVNNGNITISPASISSTTSLGTSFTSFIIRSEIYYWLNGGPNAYSGRCRVDALRIYDTLLNAEERAVLWNGGAGV